MINNENNKPIVKHQIEQVTFSDLIHFKEDFLKTLHELENTMIKTTSAKLNEFDSELKEITIKTESLEKNVYTLTHSNNIDIHKIEKIDGLLDTQTKMKAQLMSHDIKLSTCERDISNACYKYDKIFLDNLSVPGTIGDYCKYKNLREYIVSNNEQVNALSIMINKSVMDLKSYKNKIENLIKQFNLQLAGFKQNTIDYCNKKLEENELKRKNGNDEIYKSLENVRLENGKYSLIVKEQSDILHKDIESMKLMKKDIEVKMETTLEKTEKMNQEVLDEFNKIRKEFSEIKISIVDLANFLKDTQQKDNDDKKNPPVIIRNEIINNFNNTVAKLIRQFAAEKSKTYLDNIDNYKHTFEEKLKSSKEEMRKEIDSCVKKYIDGKCTYEQMSPRRRNNGSVVNVSPSISNSPIRRDRVSIKELNLKMISNDEVRMNSNSTQRDKRDSITSRNDVRTINIDTSKTKENIIYSTKENESYRSRGNKEPVVIDNKKKKESFTIEESQITFMKTNNKKIVDDYKVNTITPNTIKNEIVSKPKCNHPSKTELINIKPKGNEVQRAKNKDLSQILSEYTSLNNSKSNNHILTLNPSNERPLSSTKQINTSNNKLTFPNNIPNKNSSKDKDNAKSIQSQHEYVSPKRNELATIFTSPSNSRNNAITNTVKTPQTNRIKSHYKANFNQKSQQRILNSSSNNNHYDYIPQNQIGANKVNNNKNSSIYFDSAKRCFSTDAKEQYEDIPLIPVNQSYVYKDSNKTPLENRVIELEFFTKKKFDELVNEIKQYLPIRFNSHVKSYSVITKPDFTKSTAQSKRPNPKSINQFLQRREIKFRKSGNVPKVNISIMKKGHEKEILYSEENNTNLSNSESLGNLNAFTKFLTNKPKYDNSNQENLLLNSNSTSNNINN